MPLSPYGLSDQERKRQRRIAAAEQAAATRERTRRRKIELRLLWEAERDRVVREAREVNS